MKRIFVCQIVPEDRINILPNISQAANIFCRNFILAGEFDKIFSLIPLNVDREIHFEGKEEAEITSVQNRIFPRLSIFRYLRAIIANLILAKELLKFKKEIPIWYYNLTFSNLLSYIIMATFRRKLFILVADYNPPKARFFNINRLITYLIIQSEGSITLSERFSEFGLKNSMALAGIVNNKLVVPKKQNNRTFLNDVFLFSGTLSSVTGIEMALRVFSETPEVYLWITGDGLSKNLVEGYSKKYSNIKYFGFLNYVDYLEILQKVSFCINFRDPHLPENKYNFPSKLLEFLSYEKIVLSTIKYDQLPDKMYIYVEFNEADIREKVKLFSKSDLNDFQQQVHLSNSDLSSHFGIEKWRYSITKIEQNTQV